jgi:hypothetical protein
VSARQRWSSAAALHAENDDAPGSPSARQSVKLRVLGITEAERSREEKAEERERKRRTK